MIDATGPDGPITDPITDIVPAAQGVALLTGAEGRVVTESNDLRAV